MTRTQLYEIRCYNQFQIPQQGEREREEKTQLGAIIYENVFGTQMVSILTDSLSDKQIEYFVYCILCK